ncbi:hypothetical protein P4O66_005222, partial [Electrophorus voltai]
SHTYIHNPLAHYLKDYLFERRQDLEKMSHFTAFILLTDYERLRIGGIIFTILLVIGALVVLFHDKCGKKNKLSTTSCGRAHTSSSLVSDWCHYTT